VVVPVAEEIAKEQEYLFHGDPARLESAEWARAACTDARPEAFFPITVHDVASRTEAVAYCARCVIQTQCLTTALADPSLVGIWGGTDEVDRARMRGRRRVG
jgi:WhiB family redox-sensing transcriptional regulator